MLVACSTGNRLNREKTRWLKVRQYSIVSIVLNIMNARYNDISDFSSTLLNFRGEDEGETVNISSDDYMTRENGNLSSVLSQIQDDGPAYDGPSKRVDLFSREPNSNRKGHADLANEPDNNSNNNAAQQYASSIADSDRDEVSLTNAGLTKAGLTKPGFAKASLTKASKNSAWFQVLLILLIAAIAALTLFNIKLRTSELEHALNMHDADLQGGSTSNSNHLLQYFIVGSSFVSEP